MQTLYPVRGYNPSVGFADSSPSIRSEAPSFIVARAAKPLVFGAKHQTQNVVRQSRTNILPKIHRGAENVPQTLAVNLAQGSREVHSVCLAEHSGAEKHSANACGEPCTGEPRIIIFIV